MFEEFDILIQGVIAGQVTANIVILTELLGGVWVIGGGVYIMYQAYRVSMGGIPVQEVSNFFWTWALIGSFLYGNKYLVTYVVPMVTNLGDTIAMNLIDNDSASSLGLVDKIISGALGNMKLMWETIMDKGLGDIIGDIVPAGIGTLAMIVGAVLLTVYAGVWLIVTKVVVAILLSVSPIFFMFFAFPATRSYFSAWVSQCLNYTLLAILFAITFSIVNTSVVTIVRKIKYADLTSTGITPFTFLVMASMYLVGYALLNTAISLSAQLAGTVSNLGGADKALGGGLGVVKSMTMGSIRGGVKGGVATAVGASKLAGKLSNKSGIGRG